MCLDKKRVPSKSFLGEYFFSACISDRLDIYQYFMWYVSSEYLSSWLDAVNSKSLSVCICMPSRFSCVWLFVTLRTVALQVYLSMEFSRQKYRRGLHALFQGIFPPRDWNPGLLRLLHWQVSSLPLVWPGKHETYHIWWILFVLLTVWAQEVKRPR